MVMVKKDEARENRIDNEIIVDAYGEEEHAMGWYYYLEGKLTVPFLAKCIAKRATSSLLVGDEVKVTGMASEDDCGHEIYVKIKRGKASLAVPLSQLEAIHADLQTVEAVEDWHYWVGMGYQF
jgi:hypothetical protein